jgi:hypothetical protein
MYVDGWPDTPGLGYQVALALVANGVSRVMFNRLRSLPEPV